MIDKDKIVDKICHAIVWFTEDKDDADMTTDQYEAVVLLREVLKLIREG